MSRNDHFRSNVAGHPTRWAPWPDRPAPSTRTRVKRVHERAAYDRATIDAILDAALVCHLGFERRGAAVRDPDAARAHRRPLYVHGSSASRTLRALGEGIPACVTVTLLDGIVLARSVFEHSMNYRSVVVLGTATPVTEPDEKHAALEAFTEKLLPGRWADARPPTRKELKATSVLSLPLDEASAKVRTGGPDDGDTPDAELDVWAGHIPLVDAGARARCRRPTCGRASRCRRYARRYRRDGLTG